jgi:hypothetical protein
MGSGNSVERHQHTVDEERRIRDAALDETLESTFPASDPPSSIPNPCDLRAIESAATSKTVKAPSAGS